MTKKKEPTIHLNNEKKTELRKFARECLFDVVKNEEKTEINGKMYNYYDQLLEFKNELNSNLTDYFINYFDQNDMQIIKKYAPVQIVKFFSLVYITSYSDWLATESENCDINNNTFCRFAPKYKFYIPFNIHHLSYNNLYAMIKDEKLLKQCELYKKMLDDFIDCFDSMLCPYYYLINKKKTLNTLIKVWPQAAKFKDEWLDEEKEEKTVHTTCGIMSEDDVIKTIQKHQSMTNSESTK